MNAVIDIAANFSFGPDCAVLTSPVSHCLRHTINFTDLYDANARVELSRFLYAHYYAYSADIFRIMRHLNVAGLGTQLLDPTFVETLRSANPGVGYFDPGWAVEEGSDCGGLFVQKSGATLFTNDLDFPQKVELGDAVSVHFPKDAVGAIPGFYVAYSDLGPDTATQSSRIYFNLRPEFATSFLNQLLGALRDTKVRYTFKMVNNPRLFARRDNTVLYISRKDYGVAAPIVMNVCRRNAVALSTGVPGLTLRLRRGVAVADSPIPEGDEADTNARLSFGQHRMYCLAGSILDGLNDNARSYQQIRHSMYRGLVESGINPDKPYLTSFSSPDYQCF